MSKLNDVHHKAINSILGRDHGSMDMGGASRQDMLGQKDAALRQAVSDLYIELSEQGNSEIAIDMLAEHVAMMVEMINEFKAKG